MQDHGFPIKTFTLETDTTGTIAVHHIEGQFTEAHYREHTYDKILAEIDSQFDRSKNVRLLFLEVGSDTLGNNVCGLGGASIERRRRSPSSHWRLFQFSHRCP